MEGSENNETELFVQKPIGKSVGFWLGMFVTVSFLWICFLAIHRNLTLTHVAGSELWSMGAIDVSLQVQYVESPGPPIANPDLIGFQSGWGFYSFSPFPLGVDRRRMPIGGNWCLWDFEERWGWKTTTFVSVPLWFVGALWLITWLGALFWWRRRARRCALELAHKD